MKRTAVLALALVSLLIIGYPPARTAPAARAVFYPLALALAALAFRDMARAGWLSKAPGELVRAGARVSKIDALAVVLAAVAVTML